MTNKTTSIDKILDILFLFEGQPELTAQEISTALQFPVSTTYNYLEKLIKRGFVARTSGGKGYCLGLMIYKLGSLYMEGNMFLNIVAPHMEVLSNQCKELVILTVISGWDGLVVAKKEPNLPVKLSMELNTKAPLHAGAAQKVLLAYQKDSFVEEFLKVGGLKQLTSNTVIDPVVLKAELSAIRKNGYAFADSEVQTWLRAIAVPVFDHRGKVIASLGIISPEDVAEKKRIEPLVEMLTGCASKISRELGFQAV